MRHRFVLQMRSVLLGSLIAAALALPAADTRIAHGAPAPRARGDKATAAVASKLTNPPQPGQLIGPHALAAKLADSTVTPPLLLHVGFKVLYRGGHIPGSRFTGPGSKPEGLKALREELGRTPRQREVVLYCGCCPWEDCPNVAPAYRVARELGFKDVRVLDLPKNLTKNWVDLGLPITGGD